MTTIKTRVVGGTAAAIAAMSLLATPIYEAWEGKVNKPYKDIVGVWTVCSGDTRNVTPGDVQTDAECKARTQKIMEDYGRIVLKYNPKIADYPLQFASHTIFTANVGETNYAKSSVLRLTLEGKNREGCRAMRLYDKAGGRVVTGLQNRRSGTKSMIGEYELCLAEAVERDLGLI